MYIRNERKSRRHILCIESYIELLIGNRIEYDNRIVLCTYVHVRCMRMVNAHVWGALMLYFHLGLSRSQNDKNLIYFSAGKREKIDLVY